MGSLCLWSLSERDSTTPHKAKEQSCSLWGREGSAGPSLDKGSAGQPGVWGQQRLKSSQCLRGWTQEPSLSGS